MVLAWSVRKGIFSLFAEQPQECAESVEVLPLKENSLLLVISPLKISLSPGVLGFAVLFLRIHSWVMSQSPRRHSGAVLDQERQSAENLSRSVKRKRREMGHLGKWPLV